MNLRLQLVTVADTYANAKGQARATVSTLVLNGGHVLDGLAGGQADVTTKTFEKAVAWFDANWPADLAWPEGVARPSAAASADGVAA